MWIYKQRLEVDETMSHVEEHPRKGQQLVQIPWDKSLPVVFKKQEGGQCDSKVSEERSED